MDHGERNGVVKANSGGVTKSAKVAPPNFATLPGNEPLVRFRLSTRVDMNVPFIQ